MKKMLWAGLLALVLCVTAQGGDVLALKGDHPQTYVVKKGDTLWDISNMYLSDAWRWPQLWHANPQIENPNLIYPGDTLNLVYVEGQPQLQLHRGAGVGSGSGIGGDSRLEPQVRSEPLDAAIPAIPLAAVNPFLNRGRIVPSGLLDVAPYVLAGKDGHIVGGAGDEIYARGKLSQSEGSYGIFRKGDNFVDPVTNELLGVQAQDIGTAKLLGTEGDVSTLALNRTTQEVRRGDRLLPEEQRRINASFFPSAPDHAVKGQILAVEGGVTQIGFLSVVVVNKGARDGLKEGNLLAIFRAGETVHDEVTNEEVKTPDFRAGILMVFRTFDKVSYGLVLRAERTLKVGDGVRNP